MRKLFAVFVLGVIISFASVQHTQAQVLNKGSLIGEVGFSWAGLYGDIEYGLTDKIGPGRVGVGAMIGLPVWRGVRLFLGPEAYYHFEIPSFPKQLDLAAGFGIYLLPLNGFFVDGSFNILLRYFFTDKIGIAGRGSYGFGIYEISGGSLGIAFKL